MAVAIAVTAASSHAVAQRARRSPASEAFTACREQATVGDATSCWVIWLKRFRDSGSEAEVAYAEEHARPPEPPAAPTPADGPAPAPPPARVTFASGPRAVLVLDGQEFNPVPSGPLEIAPGAHTAVFVRKGISETRQFVVAPGESKTVEALLDAPSHPGRVSGATSDEPSATPATSKGAQAASGGEVLDFCALAPKPNAESFEKERVLLFAPSETGHLNEDEKVRDIDGARVFREVFTSRFALDRFHNVVVGFAGEAGWTTSDTITLEAVREYLAKPRLEGDDEHTARAERERAFAAYSAGCADYLVAPQMTSHTLAKAAEGGKGEPTARELEVGASLAIFRRDGSTFRRIALLSASVPTYLDRATDMAASKMPDTRVAGIDVADAAKLASSPATYVSAVPDAKCLANKLGTDGVSTLPSCATKGESTSEQTLGRVDERLGPVCRESRSTSIPEGERAPLLLRCEVRARAFQLARALQRDARGVEGWRLFGVLANAESHPSMSLGEEEGMKVGYGFEVTGKDGERLAYFKATDVGPGGAKGEAAPTMLSLRSGEAPNGSRIVEYPQLGLSLTPYGSIATLLWVGGTTALSNATLTQDFALPTVMFGGGGTLGYDMSSILGWNEFHLRIGGGIFFGEGLNTQAQIIPFDFWLEKGFYLGRRVTLVTALGPSMQLTSVSLRQTTPKSALDEPYDLTATQFGPAARFGVDILLHPDWSLKIEAVGRVPVTAASYSEKNGRAFPAKWFAREDHFLTAGANVGIVKMF
ncbi:MAG: hypothetical protein U0169_25720 [Polyangiaceae bacterium]